MLRNEMILELAGRLSALHPPHPLRVALDGIDASGKTSLADELATALTPYGRTTIRASIDGFHNPRSVRYRQGTDSPQGYYEDSFDLPRLRADLLEPLGLGGSCQYRTAVFDFRRDAPLDTPAQVADPQAILLFDGIFLLRPELNALWDFRIFIQVAFETSLARAEQRDQALFGDAGAVRQRYLRRYIPAQRSYLAACRPAQAADVVVLNDDLQDPEILFKTP